MSILPFRITNRGTFEISLNFATILILNWCELYGHLLLDISLSKFYL